jgi:TonB-linked SusC/RagA family outer membrane protein
MRILQLFKLKCPVLLLTLILLNAICAVADAQTIGLKGKVVDEKGEPLTGATIRITGTTTATTADFNGNFTLNIPARTNSVTISFVGYVDAVKIINPDKPNLGTVTLTKNNKDLNEVVVVGYGALRRQDVTGTVVSVDAKTLQEVPSANVFEQLKGRVAGLDVVNNVNNGPAITIRGNRTIGNPGADGPLIILDGVPYYNFIENINPNDIKSVEILKGASATAIYGSRGSGGVILITSNRGRVGQTQTAYDTYYGITTLEGQLKTLNGQQYAQLKTDALQGSIMQNNGPSQAYPLTATEQQALKDGTNTNWVDLLTKPAQIWDQSLRVSGGTEKTQFNVGLAYRTSTGLEPNNSVKRITLNANIDHKINNYIKFGVSILGSIRLINSGGGNEYGTAQWFSPLASPYNSDGSVNPTPLVGQLDASARNPLLKGQNPDAFYNYTRGFLNNDIVYLEVKPLSHLTYRYSVNYNFSQSLQGVYNGINGVDILTIAKTNASTTNNYAYRLYQEHLLTYDNTFLRDHHINFVAGFTSEKSHTENSNVSATGIPSDAVKNANLNLGTFNSFGGSWNETGLLSFVGRINYTYANRYNLTATMRSDGASALADGHKWTSYPSIGLGWVVSNESFMKAYNFVDNLKLRGGYGVTSNTVSASSYNTLGQLTSNKYQYGGASSGDASGVLVTSLVNNSLTWQRTAETNLALDFAFFKNRLTGSVEVYHQKTTGIILNNILPATSGAGSQTSNLGESANKGLEVSLSSVNIRSASGFNWSTDFNIAFSREKIVKLPNGSLQNIGVGEFVGSPLTVYYDLRKIGIWQISDSQGVNTAKSASDGGTVYLQVNGQTSPLQYPGQIRVQDLNGDGKIDANDNQILGSPQPKYTFGFTNRFNYKNFDLSIVIQGRMKFMTTVPYVSSSNSNVWGWQFLNLGRHNQPVLDYWTPANPNGEWPMPNNQFQSQFYSTLQYFDGSFIRAKSINLGYTIPASVLKRLGVASLRVYANVTNPFIIYAPIRNHGFSVPDPESISGIGPVPANASGNVGGFDGNNASSYRGVGISAGEQTRDFIFGINARF